MVRMGLFMVGIGLALASPLTAAEPSPFEGIPRLKFEYYDVEGRAPAEIYASMRARAPRNGGGDGMARTAWSIKVGWRESRYGSRCSVADPQTSLSITILLPRLVTKDVTAQGRDFWRRTRHGLEIHEAGHARIAYQHRDDFNMAARGASCDSIKRLAERTQARIAALQEVYDRDTRHGMKQIPAAAP